MAWLKIRVFCDVTLSHWVSGYQIRRIVLPSPSAVNSLRRIDSLLLAFEGECITILRQVRRHSPNDNVSKCLQLQSERLMQFTAKRRVFLPVIQDENGGWSRHRQLNYHPGLGQPRHQSHGSFADGIEVVEDHPAHLPLLSADHFNS